MENQESGHDEAIDQLKPEGLLYHYTTQGGLFGILEKGCVWATHVRYLNDESEFVLAWEQLRDIFYEMIRASDYPHKDETIKVFSSIHSTFLERPNLTTYFVWCLTDDELIPGSAGDRLSQWRGYSKGKQGFSLGLDVDLLRNSLPSQMELVRLEIQPCNYEETSKNALLRDIANRHYHPIVDGVHECIKQNRNRDTNDYCATVLFLNPLMAMYMDFFKPATFMKHHGFAEECEWRCVFLAKDNTKSSFREGNFGLTPFWKVGLRLDNSPSPLKRVVVGPGHHKEEAVQAVKLLLASKCIHGVEVVPSQIPYRNW